MAIPFTRSKELLVLLADKLSEEASSIGETSLATKLSQVSTEISGATLTDEEFYSSTEDPTTTQGNPHSAGLTWSSMLASTADYLKTKSQRIIKNEIESIANNLSDIRSYQLRMRELADGTGIRIRGGRNLGDISYYRSWIGNRRILNPDPADTNPLTNEELSQLANLIWIYRQRQDQIDSFLNDFDGPNGSQSSGLGE